MENNQKKLDLRRLTADPKNKRTALRIAIVLLAVVLVLLFVIMAVRGKKNPPVDTDSGTAAAASAQQTQGRSRSGFPISFSGGSILDVKAGDRGLYVLTMDTLFYVSTSGAYRSLVTHSFVQPVLKTGGKFALLFDRLTGQYQLCDERKLLSSGQSENRQQLTTGAVTEKGEFLLAAKGGNYASLLTFYDKSGKILFSWECAKEYIVSVAVAENRKDLLCAAVSASRGEMVTKLYQLNTEKTETVWETRLVSVAVTECGFLGGNDIYVVCGDRRLVLNTRKDAETQQELYPAAALFCNSDGKGNTAVVNQKLGTFDIYEISVYDKSNKPVLQAETEEHPLSVVCRGKNAFLLTDTGVFRVKRNGKLRELCKLSETERGLVMVGGDAFHYNKNALFKN